MTIKLILEFAVLLGALLMGARTGVVAGACGNPAILAYSNKLTPTHRPDIAYAMTFPGVTIVKNLFVDIVPAFFRNG